MHALLACVFAMVAVLAAGSSDALDANWVPTLSGRVNDTADVLSYPDRDRISGMLKEYERETHHQIAVLTIATLGDEKIEAFSLRTSDAWGLGQKGVDDGILVTLAMKERMVRIELGKGMKRFISDAAAKAIIETDMTPALSKGDIAGGLEKGLRRLMVEGRRFVAGSNE